MYLGKYREALENVSFIHQQWPSIESPRILAIRTISEYHLGNHQKVSGIIERLKKKSEDNARDSPSFYLNMIYGEMGEIDNSFKWLEKSYQDHEIEMYWLNVESPFEPIRNDPRYQEMLEKLDFPSKNVS